MIDLARIKTLQKQEPMAVKLYSREEFDKNHEERKRKVHGLVPALPAPVQYKQLDKSWEF